MKDLFIFLDYDGTLTPIVNKPHQAKLSSARRSFLKKFSQLPHVKLIIISGRMLSDLKKRVGIPNIYYAGNHGFEISGPGTKLVHPKARSAKPVLKKLGSLLVGKLKSIKGVLVEDKILTLSVHYRLVTKKDLPKVEEIFQEIIRPYLKTKMIRVSHGKKVFEVRPNIKWDKGQAVLWFLNKKAKGKKVFPVYIGDDTTDEDAFKALKNRGSTFRVGRTTKTCAEHFLKDVDQVYMLLRILAVEI
ncbi:MAG: trehalose-phosphatase [Candidatus Margulisiibacteriota bacterium]